MITDTDSNVRGRFYAKWCGVLGIDEGMASTTDSGLESEAESSVGVSEKDGHLQHCFMDVLFLIGNGVWNPQDLGDHSSVRIVTQHTTVKHVRIGNVDVERSAICLKEIRGKDDIVL